MGDASASVAAVSAFMKHKLFAATDGHIDHFTEVILLNESHLFYMRHIRCLVIRLIHLKQSKISKCMDRKLDP